MISTRKLSLLPPIDQLRSVLQAMAMLDAILSPEWEYRYYSFNARWSKGATYWSIEAGGERFDDVVWTYTSPFPESQKIAGLVAFYNERVDHYVDGKLQPRPRTKFSR